MTSNNSFAPTQGATEATPVALSRTVARKAKVIVFLFFSFFHFFLEGDCDSDTECEVGLRCGSNNCDQEKPSFDPSDDCCFRHDDDDDADDNDCYDDGYDYDNDEVRL